MKATMELEFPSLSHIPEADHESDGDSVGTADSFSAGGRFSPSPTTVPQLPTL